MHIPKINSLRILLSFVVCGGLLIANANSGNSTLLFAKESKEKIGAAQPPLQMNSLAKQLNETFNSVSNAVIPTVVSINVKLDRKVSQRSSPFQDFGGGGFEEFFGFPFGGGSPMQSMPAEASGSGVIISANGYIVTNNHVVEDANDIKVTTYDKKTYKAELIGTDPTTDLAIIKIDASKLPVAYFANVNDVKIGEMVLAVGNPLGLNSTITQGIISAIGRGSLNLRSGQSGKQTVENYIQTDAAINPGNSGGGLFDLNGSLIGINTAIASQNGSFIGYGFAVPIDLVLAIADDLIEDGKIDRGFIGIQYEPVSEAMAKALKLDKITGAVVQDVVKKSPAEKAGIEVGDVITEIDGKEINTANQLQGIVFTKKAGEKINISIIRDGKKEVKTIVLDRLEDKNSNSGKLGITDQTINLDIDDNAYEAKIPGLDITVEKLNTNNKNDYGVDYGVIISKVERGSEAQQNGLLPGTIILKADRQKVNTPSELNKIVKGKKSGDAVLLQVKYKDINRMIAIIIK